MNGKQYQMIKLTRNNPALMVGEGKDCLKEVSLDISSSAWQERECISNLLGHPRTQLLLQLLAVESVILAQLVDDTDYLVAQLGVATLKGGAHNWQDFPSVLTSWSLGV